MKALLVIFVSFILQLVEPCGVTTHIEIAHRASTNFDYLLNNKTSIQELIQKYQSAFQAGNPYPDSMYPNICKKGTLHQVSEDTHWGEFLNATINYIRSKYTEPYNEDALRLIVFTLGFVSHQIADVTWHSLDINQGFLSAMGFVNFHGSFPDAHSVGDTGGDVVNQYELSTSYIADVGEWYVPYKDLYNIYKEFYGQELVTEIDIIECSSLLFLARLGEKLAISFLYTDYSRKSTFLTNKLNDYFLGGLDDMATWTQTTWRKTLYMIENGVDKCHLPHNVLYAECDNIPKQKRSNRNEIKNMKQPEKPGIGLGLNYLSKTYEENGIRLNPSSLFQRLMDFVSLPVPVRKNENKYQYSNVYYFTLNEYSNVGWSLATGDLDGDQSDDLVIGAPVYSLNNAYQNGRVFIKLANGKNGIPLHDQYLDYDSDNVVDPPNLTSENSRFGHAITILDLNQDGFNDIVISAPSYGLKDLKYQGRVYVYFGSQNQTYTTPSITITCEYTYCNNGWYMSKGDVNGDSKDDLIISSPYASTCGDQCGFIAVLLAGRKDFPTEVSVNNVDRFITGQMQYEWFGFVAKAKNGQLAVGAPQSRLCFSLDCSMNQNDIQAIGRVYLFNNVSSTPYLTLNGTEQFEQFGYDIDLNSNAEVIAISSITKDSKLNSQVGYELKQGGMVQAFNINNPGVPIAVMKSDRPYAGFGSKIRFFDINNDGYDDLFIGAPLRTETLVMVNKIEEGITYVFYGNKDFTLGNITDSCPTNYFIPCTDLKADIVFANDKSKTRFGNNIEFVRASPTSNSTKVMISASRSDTDDARLTGKILVFSVDH